MVYETIVIYLSTYFNVLITLSPRCFPFSYYAKLLIFCVYVISFGMLCGGMCATEPAGYEWCVVEAPSAGRMRVPAGAGAGAMRARHASDGDILAPPHRPESGAFSGESAFTCDCVMQQPRHLFSVTSLHRYTSCYRKLSGVHLLSV